MDRYSKTRLRRGPAAGREPDARPPARRDAPVSEEAEALLLGPPPQKPAAARAGDAHGPGGVRSNGGGRRQEPPGSR